MNDWEVTLNWLELTARMGMHGEHNVNLVHMIAWLRRAILLVNGSVVLLETGDSIDTPTIHSLIRKLHKDMPK